MLTHHAPVARSLSLLLTLSLVAACGGPSADSSTAARRALAPSTGKADGAGDAADGSCQVVLRQLGRQPGTNGYQTVCRDGVCSWVWQGEVEVDATLAITGVGLLYRLEGDTTWWQVAGTPSSMQATPGMKRYQVRIDEHVLGPDASEAELGGARIDAIPFVELPSGGRLFDHNRVKDALDSYHMSASNGFAVAYAPQVCQPVVGRVAFLGNWDEVQSGLLRQGGYLTINYDLSRLQTCRGTHDGQPAWDIVAHVRFSPGGQLISGSVRELLGENGIPSGQARPRALDVEIPADATSAEIWFRNAGAEGCEAYDSNLGANYRYDVVPPADHPRCEGIERWRAQNSDMPYTSGATCLDYDVSEDYGASYCELFLSSIGHGYMGHYGIPNRWVEAYVTVGSMQGELLDVGMWARVRDKSSGDLSERVVLGRQVSADTWQTGLITLRTAHMGSGGLALDVVEMAFFVDVRRQGRVVRLWQSKGGANYGWSEAFSLPTSGKSIPYGNIQYADPASSIFDSKRSCSP